MKKIENIKKFIPSKSTIVNFVVIPLVASAIFLASPAFAADPTNTSNTEIRHKTIVPNVNIRRRGIVGVVISVNGNIIIVKDKNNIHYTVDASDATIMKATDEPDGNPTVVMISNIKVGDSIIVRGEIDETAAES